MRFSDVFPKHIYSVDFDPVRACEFNSKHLALVLKKNTDLKTAIVVPLTKSSNGQGSNKYNIGKISSLPDNLNRTDSYLVYNQVRTLNCNRFIALKDGSGNRVNSYVSDNIFHQALSLCFEELAKELTLEEKIKYISIKFIETTMERVINLAYNIKRLDTESGC